MKLYVETRLKTNSTRRTLPLIPHIEELLLEKKKMETQFKKTCGKSYNKEFDGFICRDNLGKMITPNYVTQHFHYVVTKNGMKHLRFHDLRHSCASLLLANDIPMKAIQEWLGHSNFAITIPVLNSNIKLTQYLPIIILISKGRFSCLYARNLPLFFRSLIQFSYAKFTISKSKIDSIS